MKKISRRKFMAVAGVAAVASVLTACGGSSSSESANSTVGGESNDASATGLTKVALCCDTGTIDDESFNQACWKAVTEYMTDEEGRQYYIPNSDASDSDRETMIRQAVNEGAQAIVCVGYLYGASLAWAAEQYPDIQFIAVDVTQGDIGTDSIPDNCYCITFKEEQAGYLAGYAVTKDGFTKLGFLGGMAVPAVIRYGYGYVQGVDAAAQELGQNVEINYFYGGQFYGDANITSRMEGWYGNGTEIVFACGGGIWSSAVEAAVKNNGWVVGVDVDQNYIGVNGVADNSYSYNPFITSAMKGLSVSVVTALSDIDAGNWGEIAGTNGNFGLEDGDYVGLPTDADSWNFRTFTQEEYEEIKSKIASGEIVVDNSSEDAVKPATSSFVTVNYIQ
jgi:basic membrane protein A